MSKSKSTDLNRKKTSRKKSISTQHIRSSVAKKYEPRKVRKYILQEWDNHLFPGWRELDGTVRHTFEEAKKVLREYENEERNSWYGTQKYKILEYWEAESQPFKPKVLSPLKRSKTKIDPLAKVKRYLEQALKTLNKIPSNQEHDASYDDPIYR